MKKPPTKFVAVRCPLSLLADIQQQIATNKLPSRQGRITNLSEFVLAALHDKLMKHARNRKQHKLKRLRRKAQKAAERKPDDAKKSAAEEGNTHA